MATSGDLDRLKSLLAPLDGLDSFGLLFFDQPAASGYRATPGNCLAFASTGGDGTHFGFLARDGANLAAAPVVMTVPMAFDRPNRIVGRDLRHFLGLGLCSGYFALEQLQYDFGTTCEKLDRHAYENDLSEHEREALALIASEFDVVPWQDHKRGLLQLERDFPL